MPSGRDVHLKSLAHTRPGVAPLRPSDLDVAAGEHVALPGPVGGAASTLLRLVAGFLVPELGRVLIGGSDVTDLAPERRPTLLIDPGLALFPGLSVADNIGFGLEARGTPASLRRAAVETWLARFDLADLRRENVDALPAPRRVDVALARALAVEPAALLLDGPIDLLAPADRLAVRTRLAELRRTDGLTLIERTRDRTDALAFADRVAVIVDDRIEQIDTPDRLWSAPGSAAVARATGEQNEILGRVVSLDDERALIDSALGPIRATPRATLAVGAACLVLVRPERVVPTDDATPWQPQWNRLVVEFVDRRIEGPTVRITFATPVGRLTLVRPNLGLRGLMPAGLHAVAFAPEDALAFPLAASEGEARV